MQGHALVLQRPYTISDRINMVVAKEMQRMLNMKLVGRYVLILFEVFCCILSLVLKQGCLIQNCKIVKIMADL